MTQLFHKTKTFEKILGKNWFLDKPRYILILQNFPQYYYLQHVLPKCKQKSLFIQKLRLAKHRMFSNVYTTEVINKQQSY